MKVLQITKLNTIGPSFQQIDKLFVLALIGMAAGSGNISDDNYWQWFVLKAVKNAATADERWIAWNK